MKKSLVSFALFLMITSPLSAQTVSESMYTLKRKFSIVALCGVGGAVLGLSTLSFYGEPQEHFSNVWTGLVVGLVAGTVYVSTEKQNDYAINTLPFKRFPEEPQKVLARKTFFTPFVVSWDF
jgi:drug/metabolite transporter (DMT)-like permease